MILGKGTHVHAAVFEEINYAVEAIEQEHGRKRPIVFNAHRFYPHPGDIVFNLENVPAQVDPRMWKGFVCWDANARSAAQYGATHVPVGYHRSMERFNRSADLDIDVIFAGAMNERRTAVLAELMGRGLNVVRVPTEMYGRQRDKLLARAKLALNLQYYEDGAWPVLRVAHLVANGVPVLSEAHPDCWPFIGSVHYDGLVETAVSFIHSLPLSSLLDDARVAYEGFRAMPMTLPPP